MNDVETKTEFTIQPRKVSGRKPNESVGVKPDKIRVELNIEKWPSIWQPSSSNSESAVRTFERGMNLEDGTRATAKIEIGYTQFGTLTTEDQRMFYALIQQWEDAGKPANRPVYFSDRALSRKLRKRGWGTNVIQAMTKSLRRLRTTPLRWINSFHKNDETGRSYEEEIPFQILNDLKIITRRQDGHVTNQQGYFQFDRSIETNLLTNYTKPFLPDEFYKLNSEIAQLMYTHVDLIMTDKTRYERCSKDLFYDLGLTQPSYRYPSIRKQKLEKAVKELEGIRLNHGLLRSVTIERTKDKKDFKVVFQKGSAKKFAEEAMQVQELPSAPVIVNHYSAQKDPLQLQAEELVQLFHRLFHGVENPNPDPKQVAHAVSLLAKHGVEACRFIVNFSRTAAQETRYDVQTFGGILQYAGRALGEYERLAAVAAKAAAVPLTETATAQHSDRGQNVSAAPAAEATLRSLLSPEEYQALYDQAKKELLAGNLFLARHYREGSLVIENLIRGAMLKQVKNRPEARSDASTFPAAETTGTHVPESVLEGNASEPQAAVEGPAAAEPDRSSEDAGIQHAA